MLYAFNEEPFTFVGYPTNNGRGSFAEIPISFGIMSVTENKEAIWEALSQMFFNSDFQLELSRDQIGVPVISEAVDRLMELDENANNSINAKCMISESLSLSISDEPKASIYDFINRLEIDPFVNKNIEQIIKEESDYVFNGERNIDEFVNIIKSRIGLYMSETQ